VLFRSHFIFRLICRATWSQWNPAWKQLIVTKTPGSSIKFLLGTVKDIPLEILFELHRIATDFHFAVRMLKEISRKQSKPPNTNSPIG
jgi:hypothetical protein